MKPHIRISSPLAGYDHIETASILWRLTTKRIKGLLRKAGIGIPKYKTEMVRLLANHLKTRHPATPVTITIG